MSWPSRRTGRWCFYGRDDVVVISSVVVRPTENILEGELSAVSVRRRCRAKTAWCRGRKSTA